MCILTSQHREKTYADFSNNDNRWQNMYEGKYLTVQALRPRLAILNLKKFILMYRLHAFKCQRPSCWMTTRSLPLLRRILTRDENWPGGHISRLNAIREYFINVQNWEQWSLKFIPGVILNSLVFFFLISDYIYPLKIDLVEIYPNCELWTVFELELATQVIF